MKFKYEIPTIVLVKFEVTDVITASDGLIDSGQYDATGNENYDGGYGDLF